MSRLDEIQEAIETGEYTWHGGEDENDKCSHLALRLITQSCCGQCD